MVPIKSSSIIFSLAVKYFSFCLNKIKNDKLPKNLNQKLNFSFTIDPKIFDKNT